jgi:hypothetical protein
MRWDYDVQKDNVFAVWNTHIQLVLEIEVLNIRLFSFNDQTKKQNISSLICFHLFFYIFYPFLILAHMHENKRY